MFTRWLAGLLQHVYKVSCKACTTCLQGFVQGFYNMFNSVFKRCSQGVSQGCLKGVRKMFHTGVSQGFYNVFIRCAHEVFTVCLQEICAGGWYKAPQQCVYSTSTRVFLQCFHEALIHFAKIVHNLYKCFCKVFTTLVHVCSRKVSTAVVQVFF